MKPFFWALITLVVVMAIEGCGKVANGTTSVSLASAALREADTAVGVDATPTPTPTVTEFKLCISRVRIETEDGTALATPTPSASPSPSAESGDDHDGFFTFNPGLVDLSNGLAQDWGNITLPTGAKIARLRVKIHANKNLCGVDYSMSYNGQTTSRDIELKFRFNPAVDIDAATGRLSLKFAKILTALGDGSLNADEIKNRCEGTEGGAEKHSH